MRSGGFRRYTEHLLSVSGAQMSQHTDITNDIQSSVNYDDTPIVALDLDGTSYRLDTGLGSAVAISSRPEGTWHWTAVAEGRWDGSRLRAKGLGFEVTSALAQALAAAMRDREEY